MRFIGPREGETTVEYIEVDEPKPVSSIIAESGVTSGNGYGIRSGNRQEMGHPLACQHAMIANAYV